MDIQQLSAGDRTIQTAAVSRPAQSATPPPSDAPLPSIKPSAEQLQAALGEIRRAVAPVAQNLQFSIDDDTGKTVVKVVDTATKEVVRQIPSEDVLAIAQAIDRLTGVLLKQKA